MPPIKNTIIICDNTESIRLLKSVLEDTEYRIIFESTYLEHQLSAKWMIEPDMIIAVMEKTDLTLLGQMKTIYEQYPVAMVVFTQQDIEGGIEFAVNGGVNAYIVDGLTSKRVLPILKTASVRFEQQQKTLKEIDDLKTTLADRKIIDRAKGLLMEQRNCSEDEAYRLLRSSAMEQNLRMAVLSQNIINAALLLQKQSIKSG